jgi:hypothetical protein
MRSHLAVSLRHHVSTFAYTLMENCHEVYEYAPLLAPIRSQTPNPKPQTPLLSPVSVRLQKSRVLNLEPSKP